MTTAVCPCGATWTGLRVEHCGGCRELGTGTTSGDRHRTGKHHIYSGPDRRRCRSVEEMEALGMKRNKRGHWTLGGTSPWAAS